VRRGRSIGTVALVVATCVLVFLATLAVWLRALVLDTNAYVRAVGPVLEHEPVRDALAQTIVDDLYAHVDVILLLRKALPDAADQFAPTLAESIKSTSVPLAAAALKTQAVQRAWRDANRVAHDQLVHVLEGKGKVVTTANGEIAIDTGALAIEVRAALDNAGIHVFDSVPLDDLNTRFVLFRSTDLEHAQTATRILDDVGTWLPVAAVACGVAAIAVSARRRRTLEVLAFGIGATMVVIVVGVAVGRAQYLHAVGDAIARPVAEAPFDALVRPLRSGVRIVFGCCVLVWIASWLSASRTARAHEEHARVLVVETIRRYARVLAWSGVALAALVLVVWDRPRPISVAAVVGALVLWEVVVVTVARHDDRVSAPT